MNLIAWSQMIGFDGALKIAEPATFRTRVLHVAGQWATRGRRLHLHLDRNWPDTRTIASAFTRIRAAFAFP